MPTIGSGVQTCNLITKNMNAQPRRVVKLRMFLQKILGPNASTVRRKLEQYVEHLEPRGVLIVVEGRAVQISAYSVGC